MDTSKDSELYKDISEIIPGLFLTSISSLYKEKIFETFSIKCVLSIMSGEPTFEQVDGVQYHFIEADDTEEDDLLSHFDETNQLIAKALEEGNNIIVHCFMGISRSATVIIAFIMNSKKVGFTEAVDFVLSKRPMIAPNKGFLQQLALYERIKLKLDLSNLWYRRYMFMCMVREVSGELKSATNVKCLLDGFRLNRKSSYYINKLNDGQKTMQGTTVYKCRGCRFVLFNDQHILHQDYLTVYVSILDWMVEEFSYFIPFGRIVCPECDRKIGRFKWCVPYITHVFYKYDTCLNNELNSELDRELKVPMVFALTLSTLDKSVLGQVDPDKYGQSTSKQM